MALNYFQKVYLWGSDVDTGVGVVGVEKPLESAIPPFTGTNRIQLKVSALNFRPITTVTKNDYLGGFHYSTKTVLLTCDLLVAKSTGDYKYPATQTNVEALFSTFMLKYKYHWLSFDESITTYNLPPDMVTATGATKQAWACNLANYEIAPVPNDARYDIVGTLEGIKDS